MTHRNYSDGEVTHILEWLGREHGGFAIGGLCQEMGNRMNSPVRREGAVLGLQAALIQVLERLHQRALDDPSNGVRETCLDVLANVSDLASCAVPKAEL